MDLVVDASVALKLVLPETGEREAKSLFGGNDAIAPDVIRFEAANALIKDVRFRPRSSHDVEIEHDVVVSSYTTLFDTSSLVQRALEIGLSLDHQVYDCLYLALAERLVIPLVTADTKFLKKATAEGWTNVRPLIS